MTRDELLAAAMDSLRAEWTDEQCCAFLKFALRNVDLNGEVGPSYADVRLGVRAAIFGTTKPDDTTVRVPPGDVTVEDVGRAELDELDFPWIESALIWVANDNGFNPITRRIARGQSAAVKAYADSQAIAGQRAEGDGAEKSDAAHI